MQFLIGGLALECVSLEVSVNDLDDGSSSFRTMDGLLRRSRIAQKRQLQVEWGRKSWAECAQIMTAIEPVSFEVTYPDPMTGTNQTKTFYCANRPAPVAFERNGVLYWRLPAFTLTEM